MALKDQKAGSDETGCSIYTEIDGKILEIREVKTRSVIKNVSKLPDGSKVIAQDFYLTPECICCVSFMKNDHLFVFIRNKSAIEIKIERKLVLYDLINNKLHEDGDDQVYSLVKDNDIDLIRSVKDRHRFNTLPSDTLIIHLCVSIKETVPKGINRICHKDPDRKWKKDWKTMLEDPVNSDVSLHVGDERIPAHWVVLCSRSPYFKKMFDSNMKERAQNSVTITDISASTFKNLIEFLYTAEFFESGRHGNIEELIELYYAADKYEVRDLRTLCACKIMDNVSADSIWQILQLAHTHSDKDLQLKVMNFIQLNSETTIHTDGFKKFEANEPLAAMAFSFLLQKK